MQDVLNSIKAFLYERTSSPLFGAFAAAWSIWNYKFFIIVLSSASIENKFKLIKEFVTVVKVTPFETTYLIEGAFYNSFLFPAAITLFYIFIYPLMSLPVYKYSLDKQIKLREAKQEKESHRLLSVKESLEITSKVVVLESENEKQYQEYKNKIDALTKTISNLEQQIDDSSQNNKPKEKRVDDESDMDESDSTQTMPNKGLREVSHVDIQKGVIRNQTAIFQNFDNLLGEAKKITLDEEGVITLYKTSPELSGKISKSLTAITSQFKTNPNNYASNWEKIPPILIPFLIYQIGQTEHQYITVKQLIKILSVSFKKVSLDLLAELVSTMIELRLVALSDYDRLELQDIGRNTYYSIDATPYKTYFSQSYINKYFKDLNHDKGSWVYLILLDYLKKVGKADLMQVNLWMSNNLISSSRKETEEILSNLKNSELIEHFSGGYKLNSKIVRTLPR